jgi:hypothetical protein
MMLRDLIRPGIVAARDNWRPFVLIQSIAFALVVSYYQVDAVRAACDVLGNLKAKWGFLFAAVAASLAGALLPEVAKAVVQPDYKLRGRLGEVGFLLTFFFFNGIAVDMFYRFLGWLFGTSTGLVTIVSKMLFDMLIFTPLLVLPLILLIFGWRELGYSATKLRQQVRQSGFGWWYLKRVGPMLPPNWAYWVPMVLMIYSLPQTLQVPLFSIALGGWSLLMVVLARGEVEGESIAETVPPEVDSTAV